MRTASASGRYVQVRRRLPESWSFNRSGRSTMTLIDDSNFEATRIAFVHSLWHEDIVREAHAGFVDELTGIGGSASSVDVFTTPGSFEIPLHAQKLARS